MATAKAPGGLYYIGDQAVDADGNAIEKAPKKPKDTDKSLQPGAFGAPTPEDRMALAIASAIADPKGTLARKGAAVTVETDDDEEEEGLPKIADLAAQLATLDTAKAVRAQQKKDTRVGAQKFYDARLEELADV